MNPTFEITEQVNAVVQLNELVFLNRCKGRFFEECVIIIQRMGDRRYLINRSNEINIKAILLEGLHYIKKPGYTGLFLFDNDLFIQVSRYLTT